MRGSFEGLSGYLLPHQSSVHNHSTRRESFLYRLTQYHSNLHIKHSLTESFLNSLLKILPFLKLNKSCLKVYFRGHFTLDIKFFFSIYSIPTLFHHSFRHCTGEYLQFSYRIVTTLFIESPNLTEMLNFVENYEFVGQVNILPGGVKVWCKIFTFA